MKWTNFFVKCRTNRKCMIVKQAEIGVRDGVGRR